VVTNTLKDVAEGTKDFLDTFEKVAKETKDVVKEFAGTLKVLGKLAGSLGIVGGLLSGVLSLFGGPTAQEIQNKKVDKKLDKLENG
jgi:hypothetical protein